jgi:hypothetical protein
MKIMTPREFAIEMRIPPSEVTRGIKEGTIPLAFCHKDQRKPWRIDFDAYQRLRATDKQQPRVSTVAPHDLLPSSRKFKHLINS